MGQYQNQHQAVIVLAQCISISVMAGREMGREELCHFSHASYDVIPKNGYLPLLRRRQRAFIAVWLVEYLLIQQICIYQTLCLVMMKMIKISCQGLHSSAKRDSFEEFSFIILRTGKKTYRQGTEAAQKKRQICFLAKGVWQVWEEKMKEGTKHKKHKLEIAEGLSSHTGAPVQVLGTLLPN